MRRYDPATRAFLQQLPHPEHAAVVRDIIVSVARGESLHRIVRRLNGAERVGAVSVTVDALAGARR